MSYSVTIRFQSSAFGGKITYVDAISKSNDLPYIQTILDDLNKFKDTPTLEVLAEIEKFGLPAAVKIALSTAAEYKLCPEDISILTDYPFLRNRFPSIVAEMPIRPVPRIMSNVTNGIEPRRDYYLKKDKPEATVYISPAITATKMADASVRLCISLDEPSSKVIVTLSQEFLGKFKSRYEAFFNDNCVRAQAEAIAVERIDGVLLRFCNDYVYIDCKTHVIIDELFGGLSLTHKLYASIKDN